jgi:acetyltransferase-like isoleucine patch superfamily enzyme
MSAEKPPDRGRARMPLPKGVFRKLALSVRDRLLNARHWYLRKVLRMQLHPGCKISLKANLDTTNPSGVHVDDGTYVAFGAVILAHDMSRVLSTDTYIGKNCFIGAHSIIMPGIRVGDECIIGTGAVVTHDVPAHSIVGGNPAKVIRSGIRTRRYGILADHQDAVISQLAMMRQGNSAT